ncbi:MAG: hypothetical protein MK074_00200 [Phycisphaerales bacterium]|nr:hypothetical protein [Phycisphaerales bacterium]
MSSVTRCAVHRFGSRDGYRVLAVSPLLSDAEQSALDPMTTGVAEVGPGADAVGAQQAMLVRTLPGGRIAVTRWFAGQQDDAGRPTLELRTLVFSPQDWKDGARLLPRQLLGEHPAWSDDAFKSGGTVVLGIPESAPPLTDRSVFELADLMRPESLPVRLIDGPGMRSALLGLVERMRDDEAVHLQWGIGLSVVARNLDVMTLTKGGVVGTLAHDWHRADLRDAMGGMVPSLTSPPVVELVESQAAPARPKIDITEPVLRTVPRTRQRSMAPVIAAVAAVIVIGGALYLSIPGDPEPQAPVSPAPGAPVAVTTLPSTDEDDADNPWTPPAQDTPSTPTLGGQGAARPVVTPPPALGDAATDGTLSETADDAPAQDTPTAPMELEPDAGETPDAAPDTDDAPDETQPADDPPAAEPETPTPADETSGDGTGEVPEGQDEDSAVSDPPPSITPPGDADDAPEDVDARGALMRMRALAGTLRTLRLRDVFNTLSDTTDGWKAVAPLTEAQARARDAFCDAFEAREALRAIEAHWLAPAFLAVDWSRPATENWIMDQSDAVRDGADVFQVADGVRDRIDQLNALVEATALAVEIEENLARDRQVERYPNSRVVRWLDEHARQCLPEGYEAMARGKWSISQQEMAQLERVTETLDQARFRLRTYLKEIDPHGKIP